MLQKDSYLQFMICMFLFYRTILLHCQRFLYEYMDIDMDY